MRNYLTAAIAALAITLGASATQAQDGAEEPQRALPDDIRVFDPYIGRFRSEDYHDDERDLTFHYEIDYSWFDRNNSIVKFQVLTVIPSQNREIVNAEGFYGHDPFDEVLYVFAALSHGVTGRGTIGAFDRRTSARTVWARQMGADGTVTHVRDAFEIVDADHWRNVTHIRQGEEGEWREVHTGIYTRVDEAASSGPSGAS